jgi:hypothetical protein
VVRADGVEAPVRARLKPRARSRQGVPLAWLVYLFGRLLQVIGLMTTLVAATAFFGTPSTVAMLRMMLVGVCIFLPGWLLARKDPRGE